MHRATESTRRPSDTRRIRPAAKPEGMAAHRAARVSRAKLPAGEMARARRRSRTQAQFKVRAERGFMGVSGGEDRFQRLRRGSRAMAFARSAWAPVSSPFRFRATERLK